MSHHVHASGNYYIVPCQQGNYQIWVYSIIPLNISTDAYVITIMLPTCFKDSRFCFCNDVSSILLQSFSQITSSSGNIIQFVKDSCHIQSAIWILLYLIICTITKKWTKRILLLSFNRCKSFFFIETIFSLFASKVKSHCCIIVFIMVTYKSFYVCNYFNNLKDDRSCWWVYIIKM